MGYLGDVNVVVTGAAGYVGAHVCSELLLNGHTVIGIDDLSTGRLSFVHKEIEFHEGSVQDASFVKNVLFSARKTSDLGVIHCAGLKFAGESVKNPLSYYDSNTNGVLNLLSQMRELEISNLVFSSSCSIYGEISSGIPVAESYPKSPLSPYGKSKMFAEEIILDEVRTGQLNAVSLRYFNVAGNSKINAFDLSPFNLLPNLFRAVSNRTPFVIFGNSYLTEDGTCIRDYVDVETLARAHVQVLELMTSGCKLSSAYNIGSGKGSSVLEIVNIVQKYIYPDLEVQFTEGRSGDPGSILAHTGLAEKELGWNHDISIEHLVLQSWEAWVRNS